MFTDKSSNKSTSTFQLFWMRQERQPPGFKSFVCWTHPWTPTSTRLGLSHSLYNQTSTEFNGNDRSNWADGVVFPKKCKNPVSPVNWCWCVGFMDVSRKPGYSLGDGTVHYNKSCLVVHEAKEAWVPGDGNTSVLWAHRDFHRLSWLTWTEINDSILRLFWSLQSLSNRIDHIMTVKRVISWRFWGSFYSCFLSQRKLMGKSLLGPQCVMWQWNYTVWPLWKLASNLGALPEGLVKLVECPLKSIVAAQWAHFFLCNSSVTYCVFKDYIFTIAVFDHWNSFIPLISPIFMLDITYCHITLSSYLWG